MEDFKIELKRLGDIEFSKLQSKYRSKVKNKNTLDAVSNNLTVFQNVITELTDKLEKIGNETYPKMGISDKDAQIYFTEVLESYLPRIKKLTRM